MDSSEQYLRKYADLKKRINNCKRDIKEEYEERAYILESHFRIPHMDNVRVQGGKSSDPVYETVERLVDVNDERIRRFRDKLRDLYFEYDQIKDIIEAAGVTDQEWKYIELKYVKNKGVQEIMQEMGYSERNIARLKKRMLYRINAKNT